MKPKTWSHLNNDDNTDVGIVWLGQLLLGLRELVVQVVESSKHVQDDVLQQEVPDLRSIQQRPQDFVWRHALLEIGPMAEQTLLQFCAFFAFSFFPFIATKLLTLH